MTRERADRPVMMLVTANIADPAKYQKYMRALVASGLFERFGATAYMTGTVQESLEGEIGSDDIAAVLEFPSADAARHFWASPEYQSIAKLRAGAGDFRVGLWRKLPTRKPEEAA